MTMAMTMTAPRKRPDMLGDLNPAKRPEVRAKISAAKLGDLNATKRPEVRAKLSLIATRTNAARRVALGIGPDEKRCPRCQTVKKMTEFHVNTGACKMCKKDWAREYYSQHPKPPREWNRDTYLRSKFNITLEDYENMLASQSGGCAICGAPKSPDGRRLAVDHCHISGKVRGLLCNPCNTALGIFENHLEQATEYLKQSVLPGAHPYAGSPP